MYFILDINSFYYAFIISIEIVFFFCHLVYTIYVFLLCRSLNARNMYVIHKYFHGCYADA